MNKIYFGLPLIIVIAFGVYFSYAYLPGEREKERAAEEQKIVEQRQRKEEERLRAIESQKALIEDSEKRKNERLAREKREAEAKERREALSARISKANGDIQSFQRDNRRLEVEIEEEKGLVERAKLEQAAHAKEKDFLREYIAQAERNAQRLQGLLEQINKVEAERALQAAQAATASNRNSN